MKHGAKHRSNTRKRLNNNNTHTHAHMVLYVHRNRPETPAEATCGYTLAAGGGPGGGGGTPWAFCIRGLASGNVMPAAGQVAASGHATKIPTSAGGRLKNRWRKVPVTCLPQVTWCEHSTSRVHPVTRWTFSAGRSKIINTCIYNFGGDGGLGDWHGKHYGHGAEALGHVTGLLRQVENSGHVTGTLRQVEALGHVTNGNFASGGGLRTCDGHFASGGGLRTCD